MFWILATFLQAVAQEPTSATEESPPILEIQGLRRIIGEQIEAFRMGDAEAAWRLVSPDLQAKFGSAGRFMQLVQDHYAPVYNPRAYEYGALHRVPGGWGQWLDVVAADGQRVRALYLLEQQPDGSWRTNGCLLFPQEDAPPRA